MIKIIIFREKNSNIRGIEVSGHAGFGKKGEDIVCAGVSALTYTLLNSLEVIADIHQNCKLSNGYVKYILSKEIDNSKFERAQIIFNTIVLGFNNMKESYPSYIQVIEEEV